MGRCADPLALYSALLISADSPFPMALIHGKGYLKYGFLKTVAFLLYTSEHSDGFQPKLTLHAFATSGNRGFFLCRAELY